MSIVIEVVSAHIRFRYLRKRLGKAAMKEKVLRTHQGTGGRPDRRIGHSSCFEDFPLQQPAATPRRPAAPHTKTRTTRDVDTGSFSIGFAAHERPPLEMLNSRKGNVIKVSIVYGLDW
jgi:hypothetical protein